MKKKKDYLGYWKLREKKKVYCFSPGYFPL